MSCSILFPKTRVSPGRTTRGVSARRKRNRTNRICSCGPNAPNALRRSRTAKSPTGPSPCSRLPRNRKCRPRRWSRRTTCTKGSPSTWSCRRHRGGRSLRCCPSPSRSAESATTMTTRAGSTYHCPSTQRPLSQHASSVHVAPWIPHHQLPEDSSWAQVAPVGTEPSRLKP